MRRRRSSTDLSLVSTARLVQAIMDRSTVAIVIQYRPGLTDGECPFQLSAGSQVGHTNLNVLAALNKALGTVILAHTQELRERDEGVA